MIHSLSSEANHLPVYLVCLCPTAVYLPIIYFFFPETKGRTLEEIGSLFGDKHIAAHWYGISEEEREKIHQGALHLDQTGGIHDEELKAARLADTHWEGNGDNEHVEKAAVGV